MNPTLRSHLLVALFWAILGGLATAAVLPYVFEIIPGAAAKIKVPWWVFVVVQMLQGGTFLFALGFAGLSCAAATGLDSPLVRGWFQTVPPPPNWTRRLGVSALIGAGTGGLILGLSVVSVSHLPPTKFTLPHIALWKRLLASFYGGIGEEILVHLFLMSFVAWLLLKMSRAATPSARNGLMWVAIVLSALLFALGHLPAAASVWPLTLPVVLHVVMLNGLGGVMFGWLFWRWGFECAVAAHFCADLMLHGFGS